MKRFLIVIGVFLFLIAGAGVGAYLFYNDSLKAISTDSELIEYEIELGTSVDSLTRDLQREGFIKNAFITKFAASRAGFTDIKAGRFNISKNMTPLELMEHFTDDSNILVNTITLTFIEGEWAKDYASVIGRNTNYSANEVIALWNDEVFVNELIEEYEVLTTDILNPETNVLLEGYFSANTYEFFADASIEDMTRTLLNPTEKFYLDNKALFDQNELSVHELVTLASMVQFEAGQMEDQKLVASVFLNRLAIGQRLESSVSVCYALYNYETWTDCETNHLIQSPYNTYVNEGLPIGPIANSTENALMAVIDPIESDYYYFVADVFGDGQVHFAKTYEEHLQLVEKYLEGKY